MEHGLSCSAACGIFPDQGSNPSPLIGRWILCQLSHWGVCVCVCVCMGAPSGLTLCNSMGCIACQAPLSMEFSRQEYWSGLPFDPGIKPTFFVSGRFITTSTTREAQKL